MTPLFALWMTATASAQVVPIPQFVGDWQEGWETSPDAPCVDVASGAVGQVCSGALISASSWAFQCTLTPFTGSSFLGSASGAATYDFAVPIHRFGGWFDTNADDGTGWSVDVSFYDQGGNLVDLVSTPIANCGPWIWLGWESPVPLGSVVVAGSLFGGGFAMMDDMEFSEFPSDDADGDGYDIASGDCDDWDANVHPGAAEICDGQDSDCDGQVGPDEIDGDGDTVVECLDCDDADPDRSPLADEVCDGLDNDCDGEIDPRELDEDGDGLSTCGGDCDDTEAARNPGAAEVCDGLDNDCDGVVDADELDGDGDGVPICDDDCDDGDAEIHPGATDVADDGIDQDCDGADLVGEQDDTTAPPTDAKPAGGCGCAHGSTGALGAWSLGLVALIRRREQR